MPGSAVIDFAYRSCASCMSYVLAVLSSEEGRWTCRLVRFQTAFRCVLEYPSRRSGGAPVRRAHLTEHRQRREPCQGRESHSAAPTETSHTKRTKPGSPNLTRGTQCKECARNYVPLMRSDHGTISAPGSSQPGLPNAHTYLPIIPSVSPSVFDSGAGKMTTNNISS